MINTKCTKCNGTGEIRNQEYWDEYDYMEKTYPSGDMIEKQLSKRGLSRTIPCPECNEKS